MKNCPELLSYSVWAVDLQGLCFVQAAFAYQDSANAFARQLRDKALRYHKQENTNSLLKSFSVKDELSGKWLTSYEMIQSAGV